MRKQWLPLAALVCFGAGIPFDFGQIMAHTQTRGEEPINALYPELTHIGAYSAWPWGVSRLIDGLELVAGDLNVDLERLAVTGCLPGSGEEVTITTDAARPASEPSNHCAADAMSRSAPVRA